MRLTPEQRYNAEHGKDVNSPGRKRGSSKIHEKWPIGVIVYAIDPTLGKLSVTVMIEPFVDGFGSELSCLTYIIVPQKCYQIIFIKWREFFFS